MKVIIELSGGLGNQIFQYIAGQYLAVSLSPAPLVHYILSPYIKLGYRAYNVDKLFPDIKLTKEEHFASSLSAKALRFCSNAYISIHPRTNILRQYLPAPSKLYLSEAKLSKLPQAGPPSPLIRLKSIIQSIPYKSNRTFVISGFWQDVIPYVDIVHRLTPYMINTQPLLPPELQETNYVALHLRRGDYHDSKETRHLYQRMHSPLCYALSACHYLPPQFRCYPLVIVTDDVLFAYSLIPLLPTTYSSLRVFSSSNPITDWSILHNASFRVLANSTFSVTSALLSPHLEDDCHRNFLPQWFNSSIHSADLSWDLIPSTLLL